MFVSDKSESRAFRLLFDSGAQLIYVSPKVKALLNPEIKTKKEVVLKTVGENTSKKLWDVVELVFASKTAEKDIKLQTFVTDICHPLKKSKHEVCKEKFFTYSKFDLGRWKLFEKFQYRHFNWLWLYWHFMKNRIIRGNADEPAALETKLPYRPKLSPP